MLKTLPSTVCVVSLYTKTLLSFCLYVLHFESNSHLCFHPKLSWITMRQRWLKMFSYILFNFSPFYPPIYRVFVKVFYIKHVIFWFCEYKLRKKEHRLKLMSSGLIAGEHQKLGSSGWTGEFSNMYQTTAGNTLLKALFGTCSYKRVFISKLVSLNILQNIHFTHILL